VGERIPATALAVPSVSGPLVGRCVVKGVMLSAIVAPCGAQQVSAIQLAGIRHPLAPGVMDSVRQRGRVPVPLWRVINGLANARNPDSRTMRRCWRLRFWGSVRELLRTGLLFRCGPLIATARFATTPRLRSRPRSASRRSDERIHLSSSVGALTTRTGGSNPALVLTFSADDKEQRTQSESDTCRLRIADPPPETRSAPSPEMLSAAARTLARLPRNQPRKYTGWLGDRHCWRGQLVVLPDGEVAPLIWCNRGRVLLRNYRAMPFPDWLRWAARREHEVRPYKNPSAVLLGSRKLGVKERPSARKAEAARRNGKMPVRPGSRPRGRPRRVDVYTRHSERG
jgi:hypothetical protein